MKEKSQTSCEPLHLLQDQQRCNNQRTPAVIFVSTSQFLLLPLTDHLGSKTCDFCIELVRQQTALKKKHSLNVVSVMADQSVRMVTAIVLHSVFFLSGDSADCSGLTARFITAPKEMEALTGSCLQIPCNFSVKSGKEFNSKITTFGVWIKNSPYFHKPLSEVIFNSSGTVSTYPMSFTGDLSQKNCTTLFSSLNTTYTDTYYFRVENWPFRATARCDFLQIKVKDSPPKPRIEISGDVKEKESVSISCSASTPCPHSPPQLTWNLQPDSHHMMEENTDGTFTTRIQKSITLSHEHDGFIISCSARYPVNEGKDVKTSEERKTLSVSYAPKNTSVSICPSGRVSAGSRVILTCSSRAKPPVSRFTWFNTSRDAPIKVSEGDFYSFNVTDGGVYYCVATNQLGDQTSSEIHLTVGDAPKNTSVSISPSGRVSAGSRVNLTCSSRAKPPVSRFTWFRTSRDAPIKVSEGDFYSFNVTDGGVYYCVATNQLGDQTSSEIHQLIGDAPKNTSTSICPSGRVSAGSRVNLTCSSRAKPPVRRFTWFKTSRDAPIKVSEGDFYSFNVTDGGVYYCVATNQLGDQTSSEIHLTIEDSPPKPRIEISGDVKEKESVSISCSASTPCPHSPPQLTWNLQPDSHHMMEENTDGTFTTRIQKSITLSHEHDGFIITCSARYPVNEGKDVKTSEERKTLSVSYAPKNTSVSISPSGRVSTGCRVNLTCSSRAKPPVSNFTWFKTCRDAPIKVPEGDFYSFNVTDGGVYYCVATNQLGDQTSSEIHLTVEDSPPKPRIEISGDVKEKESVSISCSASTPCPHSPPQLTWNLQPDSHHTMEENTDRTFTTRIQKSITLSHEHDGFIITCSARYPVNEGKHVKTSEERKTLSVSYAPKNTSVSISPSGRVSAGSRVNLTCSSRAKPPVSRFTWFKTSRDAPIKVSEGDFYSFNVSDGGVYYCVATNQLGNQTSSEVHLTIKGDQLVGAQVVVKVLGIILLVTTLLIFECWLKSRRCTKPQEDAEEDIYVNMVAMRQKRKRKL
ncbi:B-cell receptor CD22-like isoform X1 [Gasterosteus aculeatus]